MESLYFALKNIDRADIVTSLEGQAPQPAPGSSEEGACRLGDRDSTLLSPSVINGKIQEHIKHPTHRTYKKGQFNIFFNKLPLYGYLAKICCALILYFVLLNRLTSLATCVVITENKGFNTFYVYCKTDVLMMVCNRQKWKVFRNFLFKKTLEATIMRGSIYCASAVSGVLGHFQIDTSTKYQEMQM